MTIQQIYEIMNTATSEVLGSSAVVSEDLSNIVDIGTEIFNANAVDSYVKSLVNRIGKVIFVNRPYSGNIPSMLMDSWEYGSVLEKISADIPEATENSTWELENGQEYSQDVFYKPSVSVKFFNSRVTFEIPMSFTERQIKDSFTSAEQMNGFLSMLYNAVDKSMTIKVDSLIMRTINNMICQTFNADFADAESYSGVSGNRAVNLLYLYNTKFGTTLTADAALTDAEFIRYASYMMKLYRDRLGKISTLFNVGGKERFTSAEQLHVVMLSEFEASATSYLQSDTFHNEFTALPNAETVPYWQGSGTGYDFADTSDIKVTIKVDDSTTKEIDVSGVIAIMYDHDAMGVCNLDRRVTTNYNAKAEFYNNYYKFDAGYFNDLNENFIVFYVA